MSADVKLPIVKTVNDVPVISAEQYSHVGKYAGAIVMSVFEQIGGIQRMAAWADSSPESYYCKVFSKMIQRSTAVEHSGTVSIDDAIARLENIEDADFKEVNYDL